MNLIWAGIILYFIGCGLLILSIDRYECPTMYALCFPVAFLIFHKTNIPKFLKFSFGFVATLLTIGTVVVACVAMCIILIMLTVSELLSDFFELFDPNC